MSEEALVAALNGLRDEISQMRTDQREMFGRIGDLEANQAKQEGVDLGKKEAAEVDAKRKIHRNGLIGLAFTAGAGITTMWPAIKAALMVLLK